MRINLRKYFLAPIQLDIFKTQGVVYGMTDRQKENCQLLYRLRTFIVKINCLIWTKNFLSVIFSLLLFTHEELRAMLRHISRTQTLWKRFFHHQTVAKELQKFDTTLSVDSALTPPSSWFNSENFHHLDKVRFTFY